jgi:hypothetical protein
MRYIIRIYYKYIIIIIIKITIMEFLDKNIVSHLELVAMYI